MLPGDADLLTRGLHFEYTRDSRSSPPPPGVLTPSHSVPEPCPARPWSSAGKGGAEGGAGGVARFRMGPAGDHFGPLEKRPSCGGAGGGGFGEGAASGSGADDAHPRARPGHSGSSRQPGGPLGNPLRASSSRPPSLITSRLSLPSPSPPNPLLSKRLRKREVVHGAAD